VGSGGGGGGKTNLSTIKSQRVITPLTTHPSTGYAAYYVLFALRAASTERLSEWQ